MLVSYGNFIFITELFNYLINPEETNWGEGYFVEMSSALYTLPDITNTDQSVVNVAAESDKKREISALKIELQGKDELLEIQKLKFEMTKQSFFK